MHPRVPGERCHTQVQKNNFPFGSVRLKRGSHTNEKKNNIGRKIIDFPGAFFEHVFSTKRARKNSTKWGVWEGGWGLGG